MKFNLYLKRTQNGSIAKTRISKKDAKLQNVDDKMSNYETSNNAGLSAVGHSVLATARKPSLIRSFSTVGHCTSLARR